MQFIFDKIEERDVDFIIMRAFAELSGFTSLFLKKAGYPLSSVISIEHSFTDSELGESDITVIVAHKNQKLGLLIENKIDATAMPEQYLRYTYRGERGKQAGKYDSFAVFLIAPQAYIDSNEEAAKYTNTISYESILQFFLSVNRLLDAEIIKSAIKKQARGYIVQEVPSITLFWKQLYSYCCSSNTKIEMYPVQGPKGPRSTWVQYKTPLKGTTLYFKSNQGIVDLEFTGKLQDSQRLKTELAKHKDANMHWADTGSSLSLRIKVDIIDFKQPFEKYHKEIVSMLNAVEALTTFATTLNDIGYII